MASAVAWALSAAAANLALPENGGRVSASSSMPGYEVGRVTDGLRARDSGYWNDGTANQFPDWVEVRWPAVHRVAQVRACLPLMPFHAPGPRTLGAVEVQWWDAQGQAWQRLQTTPATPNPLTDWVAGRTPEEDRPAAWQVLAPVETDRVRIVFSRGQSDGWSLLDELEVYDMAGSAPLPLTGTPHATPVDLATAEVLWRLGAFDGRGGGLAQAPRALRDDGVYQDGGYWATPLPWLMVTIAPADPARAATAFCEAVEDFQARHDANEWVNDRAARPCGVRNYCASAAMPLAGLRRLREHLARTGQALPAGLNGRLQTAETWLREEATRIVRGSSRVGRGGVRIFTPDASGGYGAFWVRDWSYSIEGCPEACTRGEIRDGYLFLAAAQRADGCMPDRVRPDGVGVFSPGGEANPLSKHGSVDQSPFMVIVCHQYWTLYRDLAPFRETAEALERAMRFTPRDPVTGLVTIRDAGEFRPYSFLDTVPLVGDEQFSSVLYVDACRKLAELFTAAGQPERAASWQAEGERVRASLATLWDEPTGMFVAASRNWRQPSVWGSVFAVYAGLATPAQAERIARYCLDHWDLIVFRGQLRHLPKGTFWGRPEPEWIEDWQALAPAAPTAAAAVRFRVGTDKAEDVFPAAQPGHALPAAWPLTVVFRLPAAPAGPARLLVGLRWDESYRREPLGLRVTLNGQAGEVTIPNAGREALGFEKNWPRSVIFTVPAGVLQAGDNELVLTPRGATWWRYDGLALTRMP